MKNLISFGLFACTLLAANTSHAVALCDGADVVCTSSATPATACIFTDQKTAYVTVPDANNNGQAAGPFTNITVPPVPNNLPGAGLSYSAEGFSLHVNTDFIQQAYTDFTGAKSKGYYSFLKAGTYNSAPRDFFCAVKK
jgi:hypothetical protein